MSKKNSKVPKRNSETSNTGVLSRFFSGVKNNLGKVIITGFALVAGGAVANLAIHSDKETREYWNNRTFTLQKGEQGRFFYGEIRYGGLDSDGDSFQLEISKTRWLPPDFIPFHYSSKGTVPSAAGNNFIFPGPLGHQSHVFKKVAVSDSELTLTYLGEK
jgi:hypothetical protein